MGRNPIKAVRNTKQTTHMVATFKMSKMARPVLTQCSQNTHSCAQTASLSKRYQGLPTHGDPGIKPAYNIKMYNIKSLKRSFLFMKLHTDPDIIVG